MFGQFLLVGQQVGLIGAVFLRRRAARAGACDGADRDLAIAHPHQNLGAGADDVKGAEVEEGQEGRRVGAPERAVEREGRQGEIRRPALRGDHLEDVARADIVLGLFHGGLVGVMAEVRPQFAHRRHIAQRPAFARGRAFQIADRVHHPLGSLRIGGACRQAGIGPGGGTDGDLALHAIENGNDRRAHQHRVGDADGVGVHVRQAFDQPDHVIAEIAEKPCRDGRYPLGHVDPAFGDQRAERVQGVTRQRFERVGVKPRLTVDPACRAMAIPDHVGLHADDGITPAHLAAGDRFEHEAHRLGLGQFQHQRHGRVEIGGKAGIDKLVSPGGKACLELREGGGQGHGQFSCALTAAMAFWSSLMPARASTASV